jgi:hypothetical protein
LFNFLPDIASSEGQKSMGRVNLPGANLIAAKDRIAAPETAQVAHVLPVLKGASIPGIPNIAIKLGQSNRAKVSFVSGHHRTGTETAATEDTIGQGLDGLHLFLLNPVTRAGKPEAFLLAPLNSGSFTFFFGHNIGPDGLKGLEKGFHINHKVL